MQTACVYNFDLLSNLVSDKILVNIPHISDIILSLKKNQCIQLMKVLQLKKEKTSLTDTLFPFYTFELGSFHKVVIPVHLLGMLLVTWSRH